MNAIIPEKQRCPVDENWLTIAEIAKDLKISEDLVRSWVRDKSLPAFRVGKKQYRIRKEDYQEFLKRRRTTEDS